MICVKHRWKGGGGNGWNQIGKILIIFEAKWRAGRRKFIHYSQLLHA
jgi:hypothetical protein